MKKPKISVIIPAKNEEKYIVGLLKSIKQQTLKPYEVIVADAGSDDKTKNIARSYGARLIKGGRPAVGRNLGVRAAKGEILCFFDADVMLPIDFFEKSIEEMGRRGLGAFTSSNIPCYREGEKGYSSVFVRAADRIIYFFYNLGQWLLGFTKIPAATATCIVVKKGIFNKAGGFKNIIFEDTAFVREAAKYCKFRMIRSTFVYISTRRFDRKGRLFFPLYMGLRGTVGSLFLRENKETDTYFREPDK